MRRAKAEVWKPWAPQTVRVHPLAPSCADMDQVRGGSCQKGADGAVARMVCPMLVAQVGMVPTPSGTGRTPGPHSTPSPLPVCFLQSVVGTRGACGLRGESGSESLDSGWGSSWGIESDKNWDQFFPANCERISLPPWASVFPSVP